MPHAADRSICHAGWLYWIINIDVNLSKFISVDNLLMSWKSVSATCLQKATEMSESNGHSGRIK